MDCQIVLSPELGLSAPDFVAAWNETPECRAAAPAGVEKPHATQFDPLLLAAAVAVLSGAGGLLLGVASNALYDLIRDLLFRRGVQHPVAIQQVQQPDGTILLIITPAPTASSHPMEESR